MRSGSELCELTLADGLNSQKASTIEAALGMAYDVFVASTLEDRRDDVFMLGECLARAYSPFASVTAGGKVPIESYLGQVRALISLCDYVSHLLVPVESWAVLARSKYGGPVLTALFQKGSLSASRLRADLKLRHAAQLSRSVASLVNTGLVRRERFGKNVLYTLTANGRLVAARHLSSDGVNQTQAVKSLLATVLSRLSVGRQSLDQLVNAVSLDMPFVVYQDL